MHEKFTIVINIIAISVIGSRNNFISKIFISCNSWLFLCKYTYISDVCKSDEENFFHVDFLVLQFV